MKDNINIVVAGSRDFKNYAFLCKVMDAIVEKLKEKGYKQITVVSGRARGADTLGEKYARLHGLSIIEMPAEWSKYGKRAGYMRNEEMAKVGDIVVAFWNGSSLGTKHMINLGHQYKKIVLVYRY